jgi:hypothetical protein
VLTLRNVWPNPNVTGLDGRPLDLTPTAASATRQHPGAVADLVGHLLDNTALMHHSTYRLKEIVGLLRPPGVRVPDRPDRGPRDPARVLRRLRVVTNTGGGTLGA